MAIKSPSVCRIHIFACQTGQTITREEIEERGSIYAILQEKFGLFPTEADETLEVTLATPEEADMLQIPVGSPLLLNERTLVVAKPAGD